MRRSLLPLVAVLGLTLSPEARAAGPADPLFRLVPADAGVTLAVEDLRDHAREIGGSRLLDGLRRLEAVRGWLASDQFRGLERAARDVEAALHLPIARVRDELIGDALVLSLRPGPADKPEQARGLLLALPRDRALSEALMKALDEAQTRGGELLSVEPRLRGQVRYASRHFRAAGRPAEFYAHLEGGVFAWSNSEEMILGVIDRKMAGGKGLGDDPAFGKVRRGLPEGSIASLFVSPRLVGRAIAEAPRPPGDWLGSMLARYVGAVDLAGASLQWRDGFVLHTHEAIDPDRLDPRVRRWLNGPPAAAPLASQVPASALAVVSAQLDFEAIREALEEMIPADDGPRVENLKLVLRGILLGRDPIGEVIPRLNPGAILYVEAGPRFSPVAALGWKDLPGSEDLAAPLDNALRTAFAAFALDPGRKSAHLRVEVEDVGGVRVTSLTDGSRPRLSYRVDRGRLVLGNAPGQVARFGVDATPSTLTRVRAKYFPEATTFAVVDLVRLVGEVRGHRGPIARRLATRSRRPVAAVDRDLGQILALADLFQAATFTSVAGLDAAEVHRTIGLIVR